PPLYRAKKGQNETYLKDEAALTEYLLSSGLAQFKMAGKEPADLRKMILSIQKYRNLLKVSSSKYDPDILSYFIGKVENLEESLKDEAKLKKAVVGLQEWVQANPNLGITEFKGDVKKADDGKLTAEIYTVRYADRRTTTFSADSVNASEVIELRNLWKVIRGVSMLPIKVHQGEVEHTFETDMEFYDFVMESTKKGIYIQRYKGLGEMNPEQLWDTTLNPENRLLLQVTVDDAVAADETFSVLMGEQVEPRRKFIQDNALQVRGLDV
nr:DNA gyrase subunit B [Pseudobdellovibrionaceae bacterium]